MSNSINTSPLNTFNTFNNSRDSVSLDQGEECSRGSIGSLNLARKESRLNTERKVLVDKRVLSRLIGFLKNVVNELKIDVKEISMIEQYIQTEYTSAEDEDLNNTKQSCTYGQIQNFEEFIDLKDTIEKIKLENENYQKKILNLNSVNSDLVEKVSTLNILLENSKIENDELIKKLDKLKCDVYLLNKDGSNKNELEIKSSTIINNDKLIKDEENNLQANNNNDMLESQIPESESTLSEYSKYNITPYIEIFQNQNILNSVTSYLHPKDIYNLHNTNKHLLTLLKHKDFIEILKNTIMAKNKLIGSLNSIDWIKEYEISEPEVERLVREYVQLNRVPGYDLKNMLVKAMNYIDKEIKKPLGISTKEKENKKNSIFGSLNTMFNKIIKKKDDPNRKSISVPILSNGVYENINDYDKYLIAENLTNNDVDLDFNTPDEIKNLLVQFFTSLKTSPQIISNFIAEMISEYSDFLFYSHKTLMEIKELDLVKNAMHERFKKYHKICLELENELDDLQKFARTNKEIKDILLKQKHEVEVKYTDSITQKTSNRLMSLSEKYSRIETEYESFKSKLVKEFKFLKHEYNNVEKERDILKDAIWEFKEYFMRFHITDDGEIAYIEV